MPSPIESPRRTPPKASLLLRQTPALTVFINNIIISSQSDGSAPPFSNKNKTFMLGCFVFVRGFAASGDKVVALLRLDLTHHPPIRLALREKSPPTIANSSRFLKRCAESFPLYLRKRPRQDPEGYCLRAFSWINQKISRRIALKIIFH